MISFTCTKENCPNKDIENNFLGNPPTAICGGCSETITSTNERPDPELPTEEDK
jgi:hypothetical protein